MPRNDKNREKEYYIENKERIKEQQKRWREANKEKLAAYKRKKSYGMSQEDYDLLLKHQNYRCKICSVSTQELEEKYPTTYHKKLVVDHCHSSGNVRALLCHHCNIFVGYLETKEKVLNEALKYIDEHRQN